MNVTLRRAAHGSPAAQPSRRELTEPMRPSLGRYGSFLKPSRPEDADPLLDRFMPEYDGRRTAPWAAFSPEIVLIRGIGVRMVKKEAERAGGQDPLEATQGESICRIG